MKKIVMSGILFLLAMSLVCAFPTASLSSLNNNPDLNNDGSVNIKDVYILLGFIGHNGNSFIIKNPDLNGDGLVNLPDLAEVISNYGKCNNRLCNADLNMDEVVNRQDLYIIRGFYNLKPKEISSPDLNKDTKVDRIDLASILKFI